MRKGWIVLLAMVLVAALALPAMADVKASGFYRSKAYVSNFFDVGGYPSLRTDTPGDSTQTNAFVEQRFRVKWTFGNENVGAVWYLESDMLWGDSGGSAAPGAATRNSGGALGADKVQTETKNIYVWFKIPDTSIKASVGLQNQSDDYAGVIYGGADMAGIFVEGKFEPVKYKIGWAKLYENSVQYANDLTLYYGAVDLVPTKDMTLGVNFYFYQNDANKVAGNLPGVPGTGQPDTNWVASTGNLFGFYPGTANVYMPGINAAFKAGPVTVSGFFMYQTGKFEATDPANKDIDIDAFMVDLRGDMKLGPGNAFVEGLYLSGSDDPQNKYKAPITLATNENSPGGNSSFTRMNMYQMLASPDTINVSQCLVGCSGGAMGSDPGMGGRGITAIAAGYKQKLTEKFTGQVNAGYLAATDRLTTDYGTSDTMGYEVNARVDYNLYKGLDVGGVGSYVFLGDFFTDAAGNTAKDPWTLYARVNYSF
jgi:hypothetical protein